MRNVFLLLTAAAMACAPGSELEIEVPDLDDLSDDNELPSRPTDDEELPSPVDDEEDDDAQDDQGDVSSQVPSTEEGRCAELERLGDGYRILAIGDSMLDWNVDACGAVPDFVGMMLGEPVDNQAVGGAVMVQEIPGQFIEGPWDWVIINGGGNDVEVCESEEECLRQYGRAMRNLERLLDEVAVGGTQVALVGYPEFTDEGVEIWSSFGDIAMSEMEARAASRDDVHFVDLRPWVNGEQQPHFFDDDLVHPSIAGPR